MNDGHKSWEKFLDPATLKTNLISIALFITAYEFFKQQVIEKPETFFSNGFDQNGPIIDPAYQTGVLAENKSKLYASLLWLKELSAIDQADIDTFDGIRLHRNEVAHEPLQYLASHAHNFDVSKFRSLLELLSKIEKWWIVNFDLSIDPDMLPAGANPDDVVPGPIWTLQVLLDIALGTEPEEGFYYKGFMRRRSAE